MYARLVPRKRKGEEERNEGRRKSCCHSSPNYAAFLDSSYDKVRNFIVILHLNEGSKDAF